MSSNIEKYKQDLERLVKRGDELLRDLGKEKFDGDQKLALVFRKGYEIWFSEALAVVKQLLPDRFEDFASFYKRDKRRNSNNENLSISDYLMKGTYNENSAYRSQLTVFMQFQQQLGILEAVRARFDSTLFDIKQLVLADMLDSEIAEARELAKKGFLRAAGAVVGVGLEKHLAQVCQNHNATIRKKNPTIADFNDILKNVGVVDVPDWRFIQRLGDLRNLCDHNKDREPTKEEINELIDGVEKITKTLF